MNCLCNDKWLSIVPCAVLATVAVFPISPAQAAVTAVVNPAGGLNMNMFGYARAGGREALAVAYVSCIEGRDSCGGTVTSTATNTYSWNITASEGVGGQEIPLLISWSLATDQSPGGSAEASMRLFGGTRGHLDSKALSGQTIDGQDRYLVRAPAANDSYQLTVELTATAWVSLGYNYGPTPNDFRLAWAYADPNIIIDPTYAFASSYSLEEVLNDAQFESFGNAPVGVDIPILPRAQVGVVPVPPTSWLLGAALLGFLGIKRRN